VLPNRQDGLRQSRTVSKINSADPDAECGFDFLPRTFAYYRRLRPAINTLQGGTLRNRAWLQLD